MTDSASFDVLADAVINELVWLDLVDEERLDLDEAVSRGEYLAGQLGKLAPAARERLVQRVSSLAAEEPHPDVADSLRQLPTSVGLVEDDGDIPTSHQP